jgi:hypothetical protein
MIVLDLGENDFMGSLPVMTMRIAHSFSSSLVVLNPRSNKLQGHTHQELCALKNLQMLDLAHNNLSGPTPRCFNKFSAMAALSQLDSSILLQDSYGLDMCLDKTVLVTKGKE